MLKLAGLVCNAVVLSWTGLCATFFATVVICEGCRSLNSFDYILGRIGTVTTAYVIMLEPLVCKVQLLYCVYNWSACCGLLLRNRIALPYNSQTWMLPPYNPSALLLGSLFSKNATMAQQLLQKVDLASGKVHRCRKQSCNFKSLTCWYPARLTW